MTFVVAGGLTAFLLVTSNRNATVSEEVVTAAPPASAVPASPQAAPESPAPGTAQIGPIAVGQDAFVKVAHNTTGTATLIQQPDGSRLVTLIDLATDPGPDLRVYLVPGDPTTCPPMPWAPSSSGAERSA
jgi:hypothetical protein